MSSTSCDINRYLHLFSLNFKRKKDQDSYDEETKFRTIIFIRFYIVFLIIESILVIPLSFYSDSLIKRVTITLTTILIIIFLFFLLNCYFSKGKILVNFFLGVLVLAENLLHLEYSFPNYINSIQNDENFMRFIWSIVLIGAIIEAKMVILYVSSLKWFLIVFFNGWIYIEIFLHISLDKEKDQVIIDIILIFQSIILSICISYMNERSLKGVFLSLKRAQDNLESFETLIENAIPSQIIILSFEKNEILYQNRKSAEFFEFEQDKLKLFKKLKNIQLISNGIIHSNLIRIYKDFKNQESNLSSIFNRFSAYEGVLSKEQNTLEKHQNDGESEIKENKSYFFDIKIGKISWRNESAILILLNDITYKSKIRSLVTVNEYKDRLLATISHDLRSPLSAISGFFEILKESISDKKCLKYISAGLKSAKMLFFMINDLLDYSQISNQKLKLNLKEFYLNEILEEIISIIDYQVKKKNIKFQINISNSISNIKLFGDPLRLQQILLNLLGNATKFTIKGFVLLNVNLEDCPYHNFSHKNATFKVEDSGVGMKNENLQKIFDPFFKIDENISNLNANGIGLGLVISQSLAKMMHEEGIKAQSEYGKGSKFEFSIPTVSQKMLNSIDENTSINITSKNSYDFCSNSSKTLSLKSIKYIETNLAKNMSVLIVDDDPLNILVHKTFLNSFGFKHDSAFNGLEAIFKIEENAKKNIYFSIAIMDCNMPLLDGFETAKKIQSLIEKQIIPNLPILGFTADNCEYTLKKLKNSGIKDYIFKPVSKFKLREKLSQVLQTEIK